MVGAAGWTSQSMAGNVLVNVASRPREFGELGQALVAGIADDPFRSLSVSAPQSFGAVPSLSGQGG
jgi:hypothetical protein